MRQERSIAALQNRTIYDLYHFEVSGNSLGQESLHNEQASTLQRIK